jgi:PAT family beta-lactamase induction signal transducer AmpG
MSQPGPVRVGAAYLALFAALYAVQGVVAAYFFTFNPIYLKTAGVPATMAADVQSVALLPFVLKFLAGPVSDRFSLLGRGHRKPYIILGLVLQSLGLVGLATCNPGRDLAGFTALAVLSVAGLGIYDTCCDGMVIDVTPAADRDRVQGMLVAARALAAMVCSYGFGKWVETGGPEEPQRYAELLLGCAALGTIPLLQALWLPEPTRAADAERFRWSALRVLVRPHSLGLLAYGAMYALVAYGVEINLSVYYHSLGFSNDKIGTMGALRYIGRAAGGLLLAASARRWRRRVLLPLGVLVLACTTAAQSVVHDPVEAGFGALAFGVANGWADALFYVLAMEASDPRMAASTYALFMAVTNVSVVGGSLFARADRALGGGHRTAFLAAALATLSVLPLALGLAAPRSRGRGNGNGNGKRLRTGLASPGDSVYNQ